MARPSKNSSLDLSERISITAGSIARLSCPKGKQQVFLRDSEAPGLSVRVTIAGAKSFVYEAKLNRQTIRRTIGSVNSWTIEQARNEARKLAVLMDKGTDPRELDRNKLAEKIKEQEEAKTRLLTVGEVWETYIEERKPHWGALHLRDHLDKAKLGGIQSVSRGASNKLTQPGPLASLMSLTLKDLTTTRLEAWAKEEGKVRAASARLAWRLLTVFLNWCSEHPQYSSLLGDKNPAKSKKVRELLGKSGVKTDALQREQLSVWFDAVQQIQNPVIAAYLQFTLLTGARPGEAISIKWADINTKWKGIELHDKVEGNREIPATPYVLQLLSALPRRNEWVFSSHSSKSGRLSLPNTPHTRACKMAGIDYLTLHGLRRSFKSLTEWLEVPVGVVAQIQGHKPSATAEKHYTVRPLDLLRLHHERIESWILSEAGIKLDTSRTQKNRLLAVS